MKSLHLELENDCRRDKSLSKPHEPHSPNIGPMQALSRPSLMYQCVLFFATFAVCGVFVSGYCSSAILSNRSETRAKFLKGRYTGRASRFHTRWKHVPVLRSRNTRESGNRILYSQIAATSGDGLGHALATFNVEVHTALQLGLTYTHREATFGWLTRENPQAIEEAFGLGMGEISRKKIQQEICNVDEGLIDNTTRQRSGSKRLCPICTQLGNKTASRTLFQLEKIVEIPRSSSSSFFEMCLGTNNSHCTAALNRMKLNQKNALYVMPKEGCDSMVALSDFSKTAPWFQRKYWMRHDMSDGSALKLLHRGSGRRRVLSLNGSELSIAVHARRGDFLKKNSGRSPTPSKIFVEVIKRVVSIIQDHGGPFAELPVAVHIFSEGKYKTGYTGGHNLQTMTKEFVDVDGSFQDSKWWKKTILSRVSREARHVRPLDLRVYMHISVDTISSIHDMSSADVFIGSKSGLGENLVRCFSRGILLLPCPLRRDTERARLTCYSMWSGVFSKAEMLSHWQLYASDFEEYVS